MLDYEDRNCNYASLFLEIESMLNNDNSNCNYA